MATSFCPKGDCCREAQQQFLKPNRRVKEVIVGHGDIGVVF